MNRLNPNRPPGTVQAHALRALVLDWSGTTVDFGSVAPARTLREVFARVGISLSDADVRRDMGLAKKEHIARILAAPAVAESWRGRHGAMPTLHDVDAVYQLFVPLQLSCLAEYSTLIPGVATAIDRARRRGLKIGSTTGYPRAMLEVLLEHSAKAGYQPDCSIATDDVGSARPAPLMIYENAVRLQVFPTAAIAKIGDTAADIQEGLNAGAWSIGVAATGNGVGLTQREFQALPMTEQQARIAAARLQLEQAGAHYVIDTLAELESVLEDIDARLEASDTRVLSFKERI
jgi:phosphonoacetaldehyde hydrolase